ncbi:MAG: hypothetical protein AB7I50_14430 [Vicinamibacterales bacterium]
MPRVVFRLLWDEIQAGHLIVADVKNLAKDGGFYWVVAIVVPVSSGYLSVRFKPSSAFFPVVQGLYAKLRALEHRIETDGEGKKAAMAASAEALQTELAALGFGNYTEFMQVFVEAELKCRDEALLQRTESSASAEASHASGTTAAIDTQSLRKQTDGVCTFLLRQFQYFADFLTLIESLSGKSQYVVELAQRIRLISQNVSISASRLDACGRPLAVVAQTIEQLADSSSKVVVGLTSGITNLSASLRCESISALSHCLSAGLQEVFSLHGALEGHLRHTTRENRRLADFLETLQMIRLAGKIEVSRLTQQKEFAVLFESVETQLATARTEMEEFDATLTAIQTTAHRSIGERRDALARLKHIADVAEHLATVQT